jgi:YesN/AraC family two-component response regulator
MRPLSWVKTLRNNKGVAVVIEEISIIIADDQASTRRALKALLAFEPRISIVGEAGNGKEAVLLVGDKQPDLVLMDVHMPVWMV